VAVRCEAVRSIALASHNRQSPHPPLQTPHPPQRPAPAKIWKRRFVKLLVVGDSGLGKTTLISSLLNTAQETVQVHDGTGTSLQDFKSDPESLVTSVSWKDEVRACWRARARRGG